MSTPRAGWRMVVQLLALAALLAVALPAPVASAQTARTITASPDYGRAGSSGSWTIQVSGTGEWYPCGTGSGTIFFDETAVASFGAPNGQFVPVTFSVPRRAAGGYLIRAEQNDCNPFGPGETIGASTRFWAMDATATDEGTGRACAPAGKAFVLRVEARGWEPGQAAYVEFRRGTTTVAEQIRIPVQEDGTFVARLNIPAQSSGPTYSIYMYDLREREITLPWTLPCPARATTTTTTTKVTTTTTKRATTTSTPAVVDGTTTTTVVAPGDVAVTVEPALGPPGFVPQVRGTGFPPGPVVVRWEGGVGSVMVTAGDDGTFAVGLLVMPNDRIGPRAVVATAGEVEAFAAFLVVPGTVKPSGSDVSQITRLRRHLQR